MKKMKEDGYRNQNGFQDRYDGAPGKEAAIARIRQARFESEHKSNNAFVKKQQAELSKYAGEAPRLEPEMMDFCSFMSNNGEHAQEVARDITMGLDKVAFPVK